MTRADRNGFAMIGFFILAAILHGQSGWSHSLAVGPFAGGCVAAVIAGIAERRGE